MSVNLALLVFGGDRVPSLARPEPADCSDVVAALFPRTNYARADSATLDIGGFPDRGIIRAGKFDGGLLLATRDAALFNPTKLDSRYLQPGLGQTVVLLTQQTAYDMFAFARWVGGELVRSISVNPVGGVWESIGSPERWEEPFWAGDRRAEPGYVLPFHPLDMSDAALRTVLHLHVEGPPGRSLVDASSVILGSYERGSR